MPHVNAIEGVRHVDAWGGEPVLLGTYFTTDGSADPTIGSGASHGGRVTVTVPDESGAPNTYLVNFGATWADTQSVQLTHQLYATVNCVKTIDPAAGTVELAFSGTIASNRIDLLLLVSGSKAR